MSGENPNGWTPDQIKEFIQALFSERDRAVTQAEAERGKAAQNLRIELSRSREEGDDRLREHITNQVQQISAALVSAEKLEVERMGKIQAVVDALAEKLEVLRQAQQLAQGKFESSVEGRFSQVNEFRGSLDDLSKQMATRRELEASASALNARMDDSISQRNVKFDEINKSLQQIRSRLDTGPAELKELRARADLGLGQQQGQRQSQAALYALIVAAVGVLGLIIVAANALTGH